MNKGLKLVLIACVVFLLTVSLVIAVNNNQNKESRRQNILNSNHTGLNHGLCVREASWERQNCYKDVKLNHSDCRADALNSSKFLEGNKTKTNRTMLKELKKDCREQYKMDKNQCKLEFKGSKEICGVNFLKKGKVNSSTVCLAIYDPVCASVEIQCITEPCDPVKQTFSNICEMKKNPLAKFLHKGECVNENNSG